MTFTALAVAAAVPCAAAWLEGRYALGKRAAERAFREEQTAKLEGVGSTRSLAILPLVDWFPARPGLKGEAGISYLIKTDENSILLDVGLNVTRSDPSPLLHNMKELGISLAEIDTIVISHRHADHIGGPRWLAGRSFSLGNDQVDLRNKRVFVPEPMTYPDLSPQHTNKPTIIAAGVATMGAIRAQLYMGRIDEQALAIRLADRGIVIVVGCGHQSLPKILKRAGELFAEPIYAVIGGLHYPLPHGRWLQFGVDLQKLLVYGPFRQPRRSQVADEISMLARHQPQWVSLSAHDSSDQMIEEFRRVFGSSYRDLRIGEWQTIADNRSRPPRISAPSPEAKDAAISSSSVSLTS